MNTDMPQFTDMDTDFAGELLVVPTVLHPVYVRHVVQLVTPFYPPEPMLSAKCNAH